MLTSKEKYKSGVNFFILLGLLYFYPLNSFSQENWELQKSADGVEVYYRDSDSSEIKELKIVCQIEASFSSAIALINDIPSMPKWVFRCEEAKVLKSHDVSNFIFVNHTDFPFFFSDRELVFQCTTYKEKETQKRVLS